MPRPPARPCALMQTSALQQPGKYGQSTLGCPYPLPSLWRSISYPVGTITEPPPASATVTTVLLDTCALSAMLTHDVLPAQAAAWLTHCPQILAGLSSALPPPS